MIAEARRIERLATEELCEVRFDGRRDGAGAYESPGLTSTRTAGELS